MYIITDYDDVIFHITETVETQENGDISINNGSLIVAKSIIKGIYEVTEIPQEVAIHRYCYTKKEGFYKNINYVEPVNKNEERISALEDAVNSLLGF